MIIGVFIDVVLPVFTVVLIGYLAGPRLNLQARTLSRAAYFVFIPAFVFNIISQAEVQAGLVVRMTVYIFLVHLACAGLAYGVGRLLGRPPEIIAAYVLIAVFGNVGNFGLSLIEFRLGPEALVPATVYFLAIVMIGFGLGVAAASAVKGGGMGAVLSVFKTPGLLAFIPAMFFSSTGFEVPIALTRLTGLLGGAMIPVMLVTLGVQLSEAGRPQINRDVLVASAVRLLGAPLIAVALVIPFGLSGLESSTGILQASMPAAILTSIIAIEYDTAPEFVTTTVLFSTIASLLTLTVLLSLV